MQLFTVWHRSHCKRKIWIFHRVFDLRVISCYVVKQKEQSDEFLRTMGTAKDIWREPFTHPARSLIQVTQQIQETQILSWSSNLHPTLSS